MIKRQVVFGFDLERINHLLSNLENKIIGHFQNSKVAKNIYDLGTKTVQFVKKATNQHLLVHIHQLIIITYTRLPTHLPRFLKL